MKGLNAVGVRARLERGGVDGLEDSELIAVVWGLHASELEVRQARSALDRAGGLKPLLREGRGEWPAQGTLGVRRRWQLLAALELSRRLQRPDTERPVLKTPEALHAYLAPRFTALRKEVFHVLCFNVRNVLLRDARIAEGSIDSCPVDPREVFGAALTARASGVVLVHNHPSGDPEPSSFDVALTHQLAEGGRLLGITVLDHLILGDGRYVSLLERNLLSRPGRPVRTTWPALGTR